MHEMHLAQTVFTELERIADRNGLKKVDVVHLKVLDADTHCLVDSLKMLLAGSPAWENAEVRTTEAPDEIDPSGTRVIIERIEGEQE